jgi:hypothetical protein
MSDKKNIERLFQERFKDFEVSPAPEVWGNIESKLEKKESKKRIIPFWFNAKATGIAAALVLGFFGLNNYADWSLFSDDNLINSKEIPTRDPSTYNQKTKGYQNSTNKAQTENPISNLNETVVNQNSSNSLDNSTKKPKQSNSKNTAHSSSTQQLVSSSKNKSEKFKASQSPTAFPSSSSYSENPISNTNKQSSKSSDIIPAEQDSKGIANHVAEKGVAVSEVKTNKDPISNTNKQSPKSSDVIPAEQDSKRITNHIAEKGVAVSEVKANKNPISNTNKQSSKSSDVIPADSKRIANHVAEKGIAVSEVKANKDPIANSNKQLLKSNDVISSKQNPKEASNPVLEKKSDKNSIASANRQPIADGNGIVSKEKENSVKTMNTATEQIVDVQEAMIKDSTVIAVVEENALEKVLKEKELEKEEKKIAENMSRWKVRPNVAPIFMNSSKGSPIDSQFSDNTKEFENSLSLGLGVDYAVTSKISVRTGISKFDLGYNTNEIVFYKDLNAKNFSNRGLQTIRMKPEMEGLVIEDKRVSQSQELAFQNKDDGYLNQQMSYMEVPVEVSYKLLDRKFGIQFITGVSTLFLNDNKVSVISNGRSTTVGEVNNLSKVHFSTNIGLGFKYSFWKSFEANFEPTFKYQINTFNENSGGFKPYIIGLYSGLSYKF